MRRDALDRRVDLELVGLDLVGRERAGVGGLHDQALDVQQQRCDFLQRAFGGRDDVAGALTSCRSPG